MYNNCPEHPDIQRALDTGYGYIEEADLLLCPNCGTDLYPSETVYKLDGRVIGCEHCVDPAEAADELG